MSSRIGPRVIAAGDRARLAPVAIDGPVGALVVASKLRQPAGGECLDVRVCAELDVDSNRTAVRVTRTANLADEPDELASLVVGGLVNGSAERAAVPTCRVGVGTINDRPQLAASAVVAPP